MASSSRRRKRESSLGRVKEAASKNNTDWLKLEDGDVKFVRLVSEFEDGYVHRVQMTRDDGSTYYADVPCLDQDEKGKQCPGCKDDLDRRYKFWTNVIVRGDEESTDPADRKDHMAIWSSGITIAKRLDKLNSRFDLKDRDLEVEREGSTMKNTKYEVEPATDEDEDLSKEDEQLVKNKLFDLTRYSKPPEFDDFFKSPGERGKDDDDDDDRGNESLRRRSSFNKRKKQDDDDEDDDEPRRSRRTSSKSKPSGLGAMKKKADSKSSSKKNTTVRRRRSR